MLLFDDGMGTGVIELLTPYRLVVVAIEPIGNLLIVPPLCTKTTYGVV